jgi:hypothetical protein
MNHVARYLSAIGLAATLISGAAGMAIAQPGAAFQDQGILDSEGIPPLGEPAWRHSGSSAYEAQAHVRRHANTTAHKRSHAPHENTRVQSR